MSDGGTADAPVLWAELAHAFDLVEHTLGVLDEELGTVAAPAGAGPREGTGGDGDGAADGSDPVRSSTPGSARGPAPGSVRGSVRDSVRGSGPEAQENRAVRLAAARLTRAHAAELRRRHAELSERFGDLHERVSQARQDSDALRRYTPEAAPAPHGGPAPDADAPDLTDVLEETSRALLAARDADEVCAAAVEAVRRAVPAAPHVGILLAEGAAGTAARAVIDPSAGLACALQARLGEGPGPDALRDGVPVVVGDLGAAEVAARWPGFTGPMSQLGLRSVAAFPLVTGPRRATAALVLLATGLAAFGADEVVRGRLCAAQASVALAGALQADNLVRALGSRDVIGQAKGVLMHTHGVDERTAFEMLRRSSRDTNTKLVEIARRVVASGPG